MSGGWYRKSVAASLALVVTVASPCGNAQAFSTVKEVAQSKKIDREILAQQDVVSDPLLNAWVQRTAKRLWKYVRRTDVPYSAKILDSSEINAFTIGGGFVYVDEGLLDTVGSDDELAGVLGHETGHDEHRHPITLRQRSEILSLVFGLATLVSPGLAALGDFASEGYLARTSRDDEYQADLEGLHFVTKAGYDPQAMISLMRRLQDLEGSADAHIDKYLADHPGLPQRIERMEKQPEIVKRKSGGADAYFSAGLHDEETSRYADAAVRFTRALNLRPGDARIALHLAQVQSFLAEPARAAQHFADASMSNDAETRLQAQDGLRRLREDERLRGAFKQPDLESLKRGLLLVHRAIAAKAGTASAVRDRAKATLASVQERMDQLSSAAPPLSGDGPTEHLSHEVDRLGRSLNTILDRAATAINGAGTLENGNQGGLWQETNSINRDMASALLNNDVPPDEWAMLQWYPQMDESVLAANRDLAASVNDAYTALLRVSNALDAIQNVFGAIEHEERNGGDRDPALVLHPQIQAAQAAIAPALQIAAQAGQEYNRARSRQLTVRLSLLNMTAYPDRSDGLVAALNHRLASSPAFPGLEPSGMSSGEYAALRILAADAAADPAQAYAEAKKLHCSVIDLPEFSHVDAQTLEIFLGLIYLDYTDDAAQRELASTGATR